MKATEPGAAEFVPDRLDLPALREAAAICRGCELYRDATQTVFGAGEVKAHIMLVGEQPGDREDVRGEPFVGPAGRILSQALEEAGIDRSRTYLTNAVKHFRFTRAERGTRRIHKAPTRGQVLACRPWLTAELRLIEPEVLVCLGATAAKAVFGPAFRLTERRGSWLPAEEFESNFVERVDPLPGAVATVHPSSVLRSNPATRADAYARLVDDLTVAARTGATRS